MSETVDRPAEERERERSTFLEVRGLKTYYEDGSFFGDAPVKAVDDVSFDIERGETLGVVGESGCGKTTLGRTLLRLERATDGEVLLDGQDVTDLSGGALKNWRQNAQIVFQDPESSLNERMTIGEIVREPLDVHEQGTPRERRERVRELLETVGLREEHYYRYPHQFSGGQRQRVGIARALALSPDFVVLDEPVSALDMSVQAKIINLLEDLQAEFGLTYLFIAHDLSVVRHICDRVAVMYLGNVMELGETEELFENPANPYTQALLSAIPEPDPESEKRRITLRGTPPSPRDPPSGCPFSTRCPVKIRPAEYEALDEEVWARIEVFQEVLREREHADRSLSERARELLGIETRFSNVGEIREEVFADVSVPREVNEHLIRAEELVRDRDERAAREHLQTQFGGECELERPEQYEVSEAERTSLCHRHKSEHRSPDVAFEADVHGGRS